MIEEINSLRAALAEREENISKMRVEINQYSTRVVNYRVFTTCYLRTRLKFTFKNIFYVITYVMFGLIN